MADKVFPKGIRCFPANKNAPDYIVGSVVITLSDFKEWINGDGKQYLTEYKEKKQLRLTIVQSQEKGPYLQVDTYKPKPKEETAPQNPEPAPEDDLPF